MRIVRLDLDLTRFSLKPVRRRKPDPPPPPGAADLDWQSLQVVRCQSEDAAARREIAALAEANPEAARFLVALFEAHRHSGRTLTYEEDRQRRVLHAAVTQAPVAPMSEAERARLLWERDVDGAPLDHAYAQLAERVPRLTEYSQRVEALSTRYANPTQRLAAAWRLEGRGTRELKKAARRDALLRSRFAPQIVMQHLEYLAAGGKQANTEAPPFIPIERRGHPASGGHKDASTHAGAAD